jgi:hypothetical protein
LIPHSPLLLLVLLPQVVVIQSHQILSTEIVAFVTKLTGTSTHNFQPLRFDSMKRPSIETIDSLPSQPSICIVLVTIPDSSLPLLDKTLFNIGMDLSLTDSILLSTPGYTFPPTLSTYLTKTLTSSTHALIIPAFISSHAGGQLYQMTQGNLQKFCGFENHMKALFSSAGQVEQIKRSPKSIPILANTSTNVSLSPLFQSSPLALMGL